MKQFNTGKWWGMLMQIVQQESVLINGMTLLISIITAGSVLQIRGYEVPIWMLVIIGAVVIILGGVAIYMLGMPSYFSAFNDQFYKHDNPMRRDIEKLQADSDKILKQQALIMKHLGIDDVN